MSKRKKIRTSGEEICPLKPPKNPRQEDSYGILQSFELDHLHHSEESDGRSGPIPSAEQSEEEPGHVASSFLDKEAGTSFKLLRQPEKEPIPFPASQNSFGRFVPQFAKPRKLATTQAETREKDLMNKTSSLETQLEPSAQKAGSQPQEESPRCIVQEAREAGDQPQADSIHPQHSDQNSETSVPSSRDSQPAVSHDITLERETVSSASERISQNHLSEPGSNTSDGKSTERSWVAGGHSQKVHLPNSDSEEKPERVSSQEGDTQQRARADLHEGPVEEGESRSSVAQDLPDAVQILSRTGREVEQSFINPTCSSIGTVGITDVSIDPAESEQRALKVAEPDGQAKAGTPDREHSGALLSCMPLTENTTEARGESGREIESPSDITGGPKVTLALVQGIQEPIVATENPNASASEMGPGADQTQMSVLEKEEPRGTCALPLLLPPSAAKAAKLGIQSHEKELKGLSLPLQTSALPANKVVNGPSQQTGTFQGSLDTPLGPEAWPKHSPDSADQTVWGESLALELDFLPDSQIWEALEPPDFEAPPEQLFPVVPHWPSTNLPADRGSTDETQQRTCMGLNAYDATCLEDATDTVRGLVIELSNLNQIILRAHRNLEAFKRLNYCKAQSSGRASVSFTSKGTRNSPLGGLYK